MRANSSRRITIKDLAGRLGVSTATVSRAFTPGAAINPATRAHVLERARSLGYQPNPSARALVQRRSGLIGLDYPGNPDVLDDLYLIALARAVRVAAQEAGYGLLLNVLPRPDGDAELLREWVCGRAVDGVVIGLPPGFDLGALDVVAESGVPCVLITQRFPDAPKAFPHVAIDLEPGAQEAMHHLLRLGHTRIALLSTLPDDAVQSVYIEVMRREELYDPALVSLAEPSATGGRAAMHRLLASPRPPSAVFARTDVVALGAVRAIREMGLTIPGDISLIGHDDLLVAELCDPPLTTVRVDTARIGAAATELLLEALRTEADATDRPASPSAGVASELVVRNSTAPRSSGGREAGHAVVANTRRGKE